MTTHGVLAFPCPKCGDTIEVGLHVVAVSREAKPPRKSPITGVTYGHLVEFVAEAPHLHAEFWGHLVRCHQPNPHPYLSAAVGTGVNLAVRAEGQPVDGVVAFAAGPGGVAAAAVPLAGDVPDEDPTGSEAVAVGAAQRRLGDPGSCGGLDEGTNVGHDNTITGIGET